MAKLSDKVLNEVNKLKEDEKIAFLETIDVLDIKDENIMLQMLSSMGYEHIYGTRGQRGYKWFDYYTKCFRFEYTDPQTKKFQSLLYVPKIAIIQYQIDLYYEYYNYEAPQEDIYDILKYGGKVYYDAIYDWYADNYIEDLIDNYGVEKLVKKANLWDEYMGAETEEEEKKIIDKAKKIIYKKKIEEAEKHFKDLRKIDLEEYIDLLDYEFIEWDSMEVAENKVYDILKKNSNVLPTWFIEDFFDKVNKIDERYEYYIRTKNGCVFSYW